jgi:DNA-binding response OmpR family regulator
MKVCRSYRILHVCRDIDETDLLRTFYSEQNVAISQVQTASAALATAKAGDFDLFLLETRLPDGDGFAVCQQIRSLHPKRRVVFYSGGALEKDRSKGLSSGADDYLVKPNIDSLLSLLDRFIAPQAESTN